MILGKTFIDIFKESFTMDAILLLSVVSLAFIIERWLYFVKRRINYKQFMEKLHFTIKTAGISAVHEIVGIKDKPVFNIIRTALSNLSLPKDEVESLLDTTIAEEKSRYERHLGALATIGAISPLLGLFGTVWGLIKAFQNIAITGSAGPAVVSSGIAEALLTTAFGLIVAIPTIIFYNYFSRKTEEEVSNLHSVRKRLSILLHKQEEVEEEVKA